MRRLGYLFKNFLMWTMGYSVFRMMVSVSLAAFLFYLGFINAYSAFFNSYRSDAFHYTKSYGVFKIYDQVDPGYRFKVVCNKDDKESYYYEIDKTIDHEVAYRNGTEIKLNNSCIKFLYIFEE